MSSFDVDDTIAAIASAHGDGVRGVIRISGSNCLSCLETSFGIKVSRSASQDLKYEKHDESLGTKRPPPFHLPVTIHLNEYIPGTAISGNLLIWPSSQSYTRQPSAEFHTIGSPPVLKKVLKRICEAGARLANPGEFTLRAFLSGRIDLPQAEAVLSIIDARADSELDVALRQLAGGLSGPLVFAREQLTVVLAEIEVGLDFVEEDIEFLSRDEIIARLREIEIQLSEIETQIKSRDLNTHVLRVALMGLPNTGKSTLFNELLGDRRAIVSDLSGTTTDFLVGTLDLNGIEVELVDTAGRESCQNSSIASVAQLAQRQRESIESMAHIRLFCVDGTVPLTSWEKKRISGLASDSFESAATVVVITKSDLGLPETLFQWMSPQLRWQLTNSNRLVFTQVPALDNLVGLRNTIRELVVKLTDSQQEIVASTLVRTAESLRTTIDRVHLAQESAINGVGEELIAAEIRGALDELGLVLGTVYTDDILDVVFSRFCVGK